MVLSSDNSLQMVEWAKFKPEVSGSLLVSRGLIVRVLMLILPTAQVLVVCLMLAIVSISFPYWLTNVILTTQRAGRLNLSFPGQAGGGGGGGSPHHRELRFV